MLPGKGCHLFLLVWIQVSLSEGILPVKVATFFFVWFHESFSEVCRVVKLPHFFGCGVNLVSERLPSFDWD
jgi:hypothetical protein